MRFVIVIILAVFALMGAPQTSEARGVKAQKASVSGARDCQLYGRWTFGKKGRVKRKCNKPII